MKERLDVLKEETKIGRMLIGEVSVFWLVAITSGVEIVLLEVVHQPKHSEQQVVCPSLVCGRARGSARVAGRLWQTATVEVFEQASQHIASISRGVSDQPHQSLLSVMRRRWVSSAFR